MQRKLFLLFLLALAAALGLVILFQKNTSTPPGIFNAFADAVMGIAVGAGSRLVLRHRHWLVRAIASAALAIVGLVVLGELTGARSGIGALQLLLIALNLIQRAGVRLALLPVLRAPPEELLDVAHIVLASTVSWVTLRAWNGTSQNTREPDETGLTGKMAYEEATEPPEITPALSPAPRESRFFGKSRLNAASAPRPIARAPSAARRLPRFWGKSRRKVGSAPRPVARSRSAAPRLPRFSKKFHRKVAAAPRPIARARSAAPRLPKFSRKFHRKVAAPPGPIARARSTARHLPRTAARLWPAALGRNRHAARTSVGKAPTRIGGGTSRWPGILRRKPHVRLAAYEELRCPYCLEQVRRNDPRGSIECPVCHTFHHKDCWDITGTCQVPHLNA